MIDDRPVSINNETWSFLLILVGCCMTILSKRLGISEQLGAGIVGAGIMVFTNATKANRDTIATGDNPVVVNNPEISKETK